MKIIDFHAHIFNSKIAHNAILNLEHHYNFKWECLGTLEDMQQNMDEAQFFKAVIFSTPTKPSQVVINNDFLCNITDDRFVVFGSVHPDYELVDEEIERIKAHGLRGFKFHPDFQQFNIDDEKALHVYEQIGPDYPIVLHVGDETLDFSSPERLYNVLKIFPNHTFIAAHMGGYSCWDTSGKKLIGQNVYFDTSSSMHRLSPEKMVEIIKSHGADKILFGTDFPAVSLKKEAERILNLPLSDEEKDLIMYKNAAKLLSLE